jgi:hypothetical protein
MITFTFEVIEIKQGKSVSRRLTVKAEFEAEAVSKLMSSVSGLSSYSLISSK